jgi:hypothetical protein
MIRECLWAVRTDQSFPGCESGSAKNVVERNSFRCHCFPCAKRIRRTNGMNSALRHDLRCRPINGSIVPRHWSVPGALKGGHSDGGLKGGIVSQRPSVAFMPLGTIGNSALFKGNRGGHNTFFTRKSAIPPFPFVGITRRSPPIRGSAPRRSRLSAAKAMTALRSHWFNKARRRTPRDVGAATSLAERYHWEDGPCRNVDHQSLAAGALVQLPNV